jgi:hypothetical protein
MFRTVPFAATEEGILKTIESLSGKLAFFGIFPPREQKLLKCSKKRVKWGLGYVAGDYSVSGPHFAFYGHGNKLTQSHFSLALSLNAESEIGRGAARTTRQQVDIVLCRAHF